jgi:hypothetical protein
MTQFGDFQTLCTQVPSYTWCNLFYRQVSILPYLSHSHAPAYPTRQLLSNDATVLQGVSQSTATAPVGVNPECGIPKVNNGSLGNIANIIACGLSCFVVLSLIHFTGRRKAAVGQSDAVSVRSLAVPSADPFISQAVWNYGYFSASTS